MLSVFMADDQNEPWFYEGDLAELLRTVRVLGGQVVMVELNPGTLINLAHVTRIVDTSEEESELTTEEAVSALEDEAEQRNVPASPLPGVAACPHGFIVGTCEQCSGTVRDVEQAQPTW